jgi:hypothetical protein
VSLATAREDDIDGARHVPEKVGELHHQETATRGELPRFQAPRPRQDLLTFSLIILGSYSPQKLQLQWPDSSDGAALAVKDHNKLDRIAACTGAMCEVPGRSGLGYITYAILQP